MQDGAMEKTDHSGKLKAFLVLLMHCCTAYSSIYLLVCGNRVYFYAECQKQVKLRIHRSIRHEVVWIFVEKIRK